MKVFISWSGEPSRSIAIHLSSWLGGIIQAAEPWMSDQEIGSGKRWRNQVDVALQGTDFGIVCITRENQHAQWVMFEAGALAKHLDFARVIPLCIDMETTDVSGPLADWQARKLDRDGMYRVVRDINRAIPKPLPEVSLERLYESLWPELEAATMQALDATRSSVPQRPSRELIEEILDRQRRLDAGQPPLRFIGDSVDQLMRRERYLVERLEELFRLQERANSTIFDQLELITKTRSRNLGPDHGIYPSAPATDATEGPKWGEMPAGGWGAEPTT